ncbi:MAG: DNA-3-methyladenine glycosylase 2 family protein [Deltaproteobacteria bacterium]|nr:DNA-3-methyladenine glycosylase 2 family protein [Deltaproteobacteria bacterium]
MKSPTLHLASTPLATPDVLPPNLPPRSVLDRARRSRDLRFDGRFFVGVTSTGVYCRPICPAPAPKDSNVRYYLTAAAAAADGFRPCLRCRPEAAPGTPAWLGASAVVRRALRLIDEGAMDEASVDQLASRVGIGPRHLDRLFLAHVGAPPVAIAQTRRLHFAKRLLDETDLPMTEVALASGYRSLRRFNHAFATTYGRAPSALRRACPERSRGVEGPVAPGDLTLRLAYRPPYDFHALLDFLAARAVPGLERVDAGGYARTLELPSGPAVVSVRAVPAAAALELRVRGAPALALFQLTVDARRCFDLAAEPALIAATLRGDPALAPLVRRRPGLRIPGAWDPFECVVRAILGQQVSVAAARTLAARLVRRAGAPLPAPADGLTHLFPSPAILASADLSGLGLTGARARAILAFARAVVDRRLDLRASPADVVAALVALPGIGDWTAQYVALRALGEPDAFPAGDLALRRAVGGNHPPSTRALAARAEAWRPWRGYAVFHLWNKGG